MLPRYFRTAASAALLLVTVASGASAAVLWDQSNWKADGNYEGSVNLSSNSCNQISGNTKVHTASDVHFDAPVVISSVRIYERDGNVATATLGLLWISPKTGQWPVGSDVDLQNVANQKPITVTTEVVNGFSIKVVSANNLSIALPAGDYWVSLTPRHNLGVFPYTVHVVTNGPVIGDPTASLLACTPSSTWYQHLPTPYDYAIKIEGEVAVPSFGTSWGGVKSIYR